MLTRICVFNFASELVYAGANDVRRYIDRLFAFAKGGDIFAAVIHQLVVEQLLKVFVLGSRHHIRFYEHAPGFVRLFEDDAQSIEGALSRKGENIKTGQLLGWQALRKR